MPALTAPFRALSIALLCGAGTLAMAQTPAPAKTSIPAVATESEYVTTKEFKSKVFIAKYRSPRALAQILRPLGSGFKGATIQYNDEKELPTLTVRDFPENVASIEEALKRLDVPSTATKEVEFHIHVLFASRPQGQNEEFPEELKEVLGSLKSTLQYKSYTLAASFVQRAAADSWDLNGIGETPSPATVPPGTGSSGPLRIDWGIRNFKLDTPTEGPSVLNLSKFELHAFERVGTNTEIIASIRTDLHLKDGEKVVVGTSVIKDRGLIVVLTAKVLK